MSKLLFNFFKDGYGAIGLFAPILSLIYTLCKFLGVQLAFFQELSYAWALLPLLIWTLISYIRRHNAYYELDELKLAPRTVIHNITNNYGNTTNNETFVQFRIPSFEMLASNNISSISDNGIGNYGIYFDNEVTDKNYYVNLLADKQYSYEIKNKTPNGFIILFKEEPVGIVKLTVN